MVIWMIIWRIWWLFGKMWTRTQFRFRQAQDAPSKSRRPDLHDERILQQCGARERVRWWGLRQRTEREQGMWGDRDGVVFARERASVCHTPPYARMRARTHTRMHCVCVCMCICLRLRMCVRARMAKLIIIWAGAEGLLRVRNWPRWGRPVLGCIGCI